MADRQDVSSREEPPEKHRISVSKLSRREWLCGLGGTATVGALGTVDRARAGDVTSPGDEQWRFETDNLVYSSPTVADGTVYVASSDANLYAVDAATGDEQWRFETEDWVTSSPTVAEGTVYVGSQDFNLYAVDAATGDEQWRFETAGLVVSSPTVANGTVYVGSDDSNLYAIDGATGDEQWRFDTARQVDSSPTVADGTVYVGSWDGNLYAVETGHTESSRGPRVRLRTLGHHTDATPESDESTTTTDVATTGSGTEDQTEGGGGSTPGFGVGTLLAGLTGTGYLLWRDSEDDSGE